MTDTVRRSHPRKVKEELRTKAQRHRQEKCLSNQTISLEEAVKAINKKEEPSVLDTQIDQLLGTEDTKRQAQVKEKLLKMSTRERAIFQQENPELWESVFPKEEEKMAKPAQYEQYKKLITDRPNDIYKLPYNVRLYAKNHDPEFDTFITVATMSIEAVRQGNSNPIHKKLKEM